MRKLILHSGGQDSVATMIEYIDKFKPDNILSVGINYGQKHFTMENAAAYRFCDEYNINRRVLEIPINQINKGRSLTDVNVTVPTEMAKQRDTVVNYRNSIFILFAAGLALQEDCDEIVLGVNFDDFQNYHDCRPIFFEMIQNTIQAGITNPVIGSENFEDDLILKEGVRVLDPTKIDIKISTPLIHETKRQTVKRIVEKYGLHVYKNSWSCYNGGLGEFNSKPCLVCPACRERIDAFEFNGYNDPAGY